VWVLSHEKEIRFIDHVPLVYVPLWTNKNALKRKAICSSKSLVPLYQTAQYHNPERKQSSQIQNQYFKGEMSQFIISLKPLQQ
jgi:hypothetical protein